MKNSLKTFYWRNPGILQSPFPLMCVKAYLKPVKDKKGYFLRVLLETIYQFAATGIKNLVNAY